MESNIHIDTTRMTQPINGPEHAINATNWIPNRVVEPQQSDAGERHDSKIIDRVFIQRLAIATVVGITVVGSALAFGGEYVGHRIGDGIMDTVNSRITREAPKLEQNLTDRLSNNIFPSAVCSYASNHSFIPKVMRTKEMDCSPHKSNGGH